MKKVTAILLLVCILIGIVPTYSAQEQTIPFSVLERIAEKNEPNVDFVQAQAKKATVGYGVPSTLMDGQMAVPGQQMPLRYITVGGSATAKMYCYVFKADINKLNNPNFDDDPIATFRGSLPSWNGDISEETFHWDTTGCKTGTYSVLSFTVVNNNQVVADTALAFEVQLVSKEVPLQKVIVRDAETDAQVKALCVQPGQERAYLIERVPKQTTDCSNFYVKTYGDMQVEEYNGLVYVATNTLGYGTMNVKIDNKTFVFDISGCSNETGHKYTATQVKNATSNTYGIKLYECQHCGYSYVQTQATLNEIFKKFQDVPQSAWFYDEVKWAVSTGLLNGMSEAWFRPDYTMTRSMLVTVLWRYAGSPAMEYSPIFTDVASGTWYTDAVIWASENGVVNGVGDGKFAPDATVSREQMATILFRYAAQLGIDTSERQELDTFADSESISEYAVEALQWAAYHGIIGGIAEDGQLYIQPQGNATRAQVCAVMMRAINKVLYVNCYQIELPDCEILAGGSWGNGSWHFYEDGTMAVSPEAFEGSSDNLGDYKALIKRIVILDGITTETNFGGNYPLLESVEMADSVETIADRAFSECPNLKQVRFSENLKIIEPFAFSNTGIEYLDIPDSVQYIYYSAFLNCRELKEAHLPDGLYDKRGGYQLEMFKIFKECTALERVYLGAAQRYVAKEMFKSCTSLKEIVFAAGVNEIQSEAFMNCSSLTDVTLPKGVYKLNINAFRSCSGLKTITILNPYLTINKSNSTDSDIPFPRGCTIRGYAGSTAQQIAEYYGYNFEAITQ